MVETPIALTETEERALRLLVERPWTCANLGDALWGGDRRSGNCSCPYARPAGRIVASLRGKGLVEREPDRHHTLYAATRAGKARVGGTHGA